MKKRGGTTLSVIALATAVSALLMCLPVFAGQGVERSIVSTKSCRTPEAVVFSCDIGRKQVAICLDKSQKTIRYQFGRRGLTPELQVTSATLTANSAINVAAETAFMAGAHFSVYTISVMNEGVIYEINIPESYSHNITYLTVLAPNKKSVHFSCARGTELANIDLLETLNQSK